jgi:hypothetical protein
MHSCCLHADGVFTQLCSHDERSHVTNRVAGFNQKKFTYVALQKCVILTFLREWCLRRVCFPLIVVVCSWDVQRTFDVGKKKASDGVDLNL